MVKKNSVKCKQSPVFSSSLIVDVASVAKCCDKPPPQISLLQGFVLSEYFPSSLGNVATICHIINDIAIQPLQSLFNCDFRAVVHLFVCSLLRTGIQPTLDPSADTLCRSNLLAQERKGIGWCMRVYA